MISRRPSARGSSQAARSRIAMWVSRAGMAAWVLSFCTAAWAGPDWYRIDPVHTRVLFFVDHAGFSRSVGMFRPVEGGLWFDRDDWSNSRVALCLPLATLDMGDERWQRTLHGGNWFDARRHPELCFESNRVELLEPPRGRLHGVLSVRGVRKPVVFDFSLNDERRFALTLKRRLGISATGTLSRADFGMTRDQSLVGDRVDIVIELEAQRADPPATAQPAPEAGE